MNELDVFAMIRPEPEPIDPDWRAGLRASLVECAARTAERAEIDPVDAEAELVMLRSHLAGSPRSMWPVAIGLVATLVILTGLAVISLGGGKSITPQGPATSTSDPIVSTTAPAPGSSTVATTPLTTALAGGDPWLPPGVSVPESIAILDPGPPGEIPIRDNPITSWLQYGTEPRTPQRWFVKRDGTGLVTGGVSVKTQAKTAGSLPNGESAGIAGLDARVLPSVVPTIHVIMWTDSDEMFTAGSLGDVDLAELTGVVGQFASATTLGELRAPDGFSELAVPTELSVVTYAATADGNPDATLITSRVEPSADLQALALMTPGRTGPITPTPRGDGYQTTMFEGSQVLVFPIGPDAIATVIVPAGVDPAAIASGVRTVATDTVAVRPTYASSVGMNPVPATAVPQFGVIDGRRLVGYSYTDQAGEQCVYVEVTGAAAAPRCTTSQAPPCSWIERPTNDAFVAVVPDQADTLQVSFDGQMVATSIVQYDGFTLAYGTAPPAYATVTITVDGNPNCTR